MRCIAHRGFAAEHPENTVPAVLAAAAAGADCVEVDVRRCGTGELVVCHDATVDRVTDGTGAVAECSRAALAGLDVLDSGAGVPTLADVLDALPAGVGLVPELKERGLAADLDGLLADADDALVSSFDPAALAEVELPTALLVGRDAEPAPDERTGALDRAAELGCVAVHPHRSWVDAAFVRAAHERGLAVNAWTVREASTAARLADAGVDGVIADAARCCRG